MPSKRTYNLQLVKKPPCDHRTGKCAEEDRPALRRYQGVIGFMRKGHTEAEAIALYDRPRGVCACGAQVEGRGRRCNDCVLAKQRTKQAQYRAENRGKKPKTCKYPGCTTVFVGWRRRLFCDDHTIAGRPKKYKVKPKAVKAVKPVLPPTWEQPRKTAALANKRFTAHVAAKAEPVKVEPKIINPGVQITRIPSTMPDWRYTSPEELDPAKCAAVEKIEAKWRRA